MAYSRLHLPSSLDLDPFSDLHKNKCFEGFHKLNDFLKNPAVVYDVRAAEGYIRILPFATSRQMIPLG